MAWKTILLASALTVAAIPAGASPDVAEAEGVPPASDGALYCLKMEPVTGTRIGSILCLTKQEWAENEIDLDEAWPQDGVRVIGG